MKLTHETGAHNNGNSNSTDTSTTTDTNSNNIIKEKNAKGRHTVLQIRMKLKNLPSSPPLFFLLLVNIVCGLCLSFFAIVLVYRKRILRSFLTSILRSLLGSLLFRKLWGPQEAF